MMETKEQKPWYHGVKWVSSGMAFKRRHYSYAIVENYFGEGPSPTVALLSSSTPGAITESADAHKHAALIAAAPETATQRDSLLSVQKQLVEALEGVVTAEPFDLHVGYDGSGSYVYTPAIKLDDDLVDKARAAILAAKASS